MAGHLKRRVLVNFMFMLFLLGTLNIKSLVVSASAEPSEIYFLEENARNVWDLEKNYHKILELAAYGNFSVLILSHIYRTGFFGPGGFYAEWWIIATTLQPDGNGLIHELLLRTTYPYPSLRKTYTSSLNYNKVSLDYGVSIIQEFINKDPNQYWVGFTNDNLHVVGPFLIYKCPPMDFGITIVLNLNTANLMIAATSVWMGSGRLLIPEDSSSSGSIKDMFIIAKKFGTMLGDPNWDPEADLNNDGAVNIVDLFLIARNFG